jgi:hypothetical protein
MRRGAWLVVALAACFQAREPAGPDGVVVSDVDASRSRDGAPDAGGDAPPVLPIDAAPGCPTRSGCVRFGCTGSTKCYLACNDTTQTWAEADAECRALGMRLVVFERPGEAGCVRLHGDGDSRWVGAVQDPGAVALGEGWTWVGAGPGLTLGPGDWEIGQPDDEDEDEADHHEQCALQEDLDVLRDTSCTVDLDFVCEEP